MTKVRFLIYCLFAATMLFIVPGCDDAGCPEEEPWIIVMECPGGGNEVFETVCCSDANNESDAWALANQQAAGGCVAVSTLQAPTSPSCGN
jgi:hypothetical protein